MTISLQDNGIHVHKTLEKEDHYIIPPIPQIGSLIKEVIEEVAEELNAKAIVFRYGEESREEVDDLILSEAWYDLERLALAASKHAALSGDFETKVILGIVKFSASVYAATAIRKEDTFPLFQIFMDSSSGVPLIKVYNELGQLVEERRESVDDFETYVKDMVSSEDVAVVYGDSEVGFPSPKEITLEDGSRYYVGVIFKYFLGFFPSSSVKEVSSRRLLVKNKGKLVRTLRALLYVEKLGKDEGVEIVMSSHAIPLNLLPEELNRLTNRVTRSLKKRGLSYDLKEVLEDPYVEELRNYRPEYGSGEVYLGIRVIPVGFVIVTKSKEEFEQVTSRIANGPTNDGAEILDELVKKSVSGYFIGYLMSLKEALIIYSDITSELMKGDK
ncbi:hypothetical protein GWK48_08345 [Metallosphaera tengchongensis]|uniref:Uncharacterized protein n=1 Tax=Metallosphaera tengchongensis TaxID=1532350 RepID=A0A6N0NWC9_9CREN|nr:hypothetical protein GWK48_08345 [Metallosphaera tengchongensis]